MAEEPTTGSCLCGAVTYEVTGRLHNVVMCHCGQCRKMTGHAFASIPVKSDAITLTAQPTLKWFASSDRAERGFCSTCGTSLFWQSPDSPFWGVAAGSIDGDTGLRTKGHIFCADKGDYYEITDGDFQHPQDFESQEADG